MRRLAFAMAALAVVACEGDGQRSLDRSIAAYDDRQYAQALDLAESAAGEARTSKESDEAAYLAGMSAYRLGRFADAERWLAQAARSSDRWMAGQAGITLGSAQLRLGRTSDAARSFARAAEKLDDEDARRARIAAGNAYRDLGDPTRADEQFRLAGGGTATGTATARGEQGSRTPIGAAPIGRTGVSPADSSSTVGDFTLQAGAFRDEGKARRRADDLRGRSVRTGLGEPRVVAKRTSDGLTLYVVQIGSFRDRSAADGALGRLGESGIVVARAPSG